MQLEIRRACRSDWCADTIWFMLRSTRGVTKYLMGVGAWVTLKAFLQTLSTRSQYLLHVPDRCPGHCSNQAYFSQRKLDPASCQCQQCPPPLSFNPTSPPLRNALQWLHLILHPSCLQAAVPWAVWGQFVHGCPRSIHPLWWNGILGPPLCLLVSISGLRMISVTDSEHPGGI